MNYRLYILMSVALLFAACASDDKVEQWKDNGKIEIAFAVPAFTFEHVDGTGGVRATTRATDPGSPAERAVNNLYLFLFPTSGTQTVVKHYVYASAFSGGSWSTTDNKITLNMTRAEAGERQVYIVANIDGDLKTALDDVRVVADLEDVYRTTAQPWSTGIASPILMTGNATHNFIDDGYLLSNVPLIRAVAKIELNVKLSSGFQVVPTITSGNLEEYRYRYVDFDTYTYVVKPEIKFPYLASSSPDAAVWRDTERIAWGNSLNGTSPDVGADYTIDENNGKVTALRLITYLNEQDEAGAVIEIELPRVDQGPLPPSEFGPELYRLPLPAKVERNNWYRYDIEI